MFIQPYTWIQKIRKHNYKKFAKSIMITKVIKITKLNQFRIHVPPKLLQEYDGKELFSRQEWLQKESSISNYDLWYQLGTFNNLKKWKHPWQKFELKTLLIKFRVQGFYLIKQCLGLKN